MNKFFVGFCFESAAAALAAAGLGADPNHKQMVGAEGGRTQDQVRIVGSLINMRHFRTIYQLEINKIQSTKQKQPCSCQNFADNVTS